MVCRDSLSDSDEVMSEPRTKLSLLCPTETPSLLAFYGIGLFFYLILRSTTLCCHFTRMHCLAECTMLQREGEKCKEEKSITSLHGVRGPLWCNSSRSLFNLQWPYLQSSITTMRKQGERGWVKCERSCVYLAFMGNHILVLWLNDWIWCNPQP